MEEMLIIDELKLQLTHYSVMQLSTGRGHTDAAADRK